MTDTERARLRAERHAVLMRLCGAIMDGLHVRYWPIYETPAICWVVAADSFKIWRWVGYRDRGRGRHWDRTRRSA